MVIIPRICCVSIECPSTFGKCFVPFHSRTTTDKNIFCPVLSIISIQKGATGVYSLLVVMAALVDNSSPTISVGLLVELETFHVFLPKSSRFLWSCSFVWSLQTRDFVPLMVGSANAVLSIMGNSQSVPPNTLNRKSHVGCHSGQLVTNWTNNQQSHA